MHNYFLSPLFLFLFFFSFLFFSFFSFNFVHLLFIFFPSLFLFHFSLLLFLSLFSTFPVPEPPVSRSFTPRLPLSPSPSPPLDLRRRRATGRTPPRLSSSSLGNSPPLLPNPPLSGLHSRSPPCSGGGGAAPVHSEVQRGTTTSARARDGYVARRRPREASRAEEEASLRRLLQVRRLQLSAVRSRQRQRGRGVAALLGFGQGVCRPTGAEQRAGREGNRGSGPQGHIRHFTRWVPTWQVPKIVKS